MITDSFIKSKRFAYIALVLGLIGIAIKLSVILTYDSHLIAEFPDLISRWNHIGFFTILTNILIDVWLILVALSILFNINKLLDFITQSRIQGFLTAMIFTVGFIYCFVLFWFDTLYSMNLWWGNLSTFWHHVVTPIFMVALFFRPYDKTKLPQKSLLLWMLYPLAYLIITMIRGATTAWYPYPFLDSKWEMFADLNLNPYLGISLGIAFLFFFILGTGLLTIKIHNKNIERKP